MVGIEPEKPLKDQSAHLASEPATQPIRLDLIFFFITGMELAM